MRRADVLGIGALLVLASKLAHGIGEVRDLPTSDEAGYETSGVRMLWAILGHTPVRRPPAEWAPLYASWYGALAAVVRDPVRLFDASWAMLITLCVVGLFLLARKLGQGAAASVAIAAGPLATGFFHVQPFPSLLVLVILLAACLGATVCSTRIAQASVFTVAFGCAAFVRPEAALGFCACLSVLAVRAGRTLREGRWKSATVYLVSALGPAAVLAFVFGNPLGGGRAFEAFSQHYAFTLTRREHLAGNPWLNFANLVRRDFGGSTTVAQAFLANPKALLAHALYNVREIPGNVLDLCSLRTSVTRQASVPVQALSAIALVGCSIALVASLRRRPIEGSADAFARAAFALACASAAPGVAIVFPRAHYLVVPCALGWVLASNTALKWLTTRVLRRPPPALAWMRGDVSRVFAATAVLWLLVPSAATSDPDPMPVRRAVAWLRAFRPTPAPVFSAEVDLAAFAGLEGPLTSGWTKHEPLLQIFRREHIGIATFEDRMLGRDNLAGDPDVAAFLATPDAYGFSEVYRDPGVVSVFVGPSAVASLAREGR